MQVQIGTYRGATLLGGYERSKVCDPGTASQKAYLQNSEEAGAADYEILYAPSRISASKLLSGIDLQSNPEMERGLHFRAVAIRWMAVRRVPD